ncbi:hypothetical protein [Phaffia rhodozyma]|uniref:Uncharacterized protein n=1 Tax=Phaffia rhodozyma TaxID=264483 RepID=A0A0F7SH40_PHARH|nr:hypothetical protein [Phaffia rhodozyma]
MFHASRFISRYLLVYLSFNWTRRDMHPSQLTWSQQETYSTAALIAELNHPDLTIEEAEDIFLNIIHGRLMEGKDRWSVGKELEEIARSIPVRRTISLSAVRQATFFHLATLSKEAFVTAQSRAKVVTSLKSHERSPHKGKEVLLEYVNTMERVTGRWIGVGAGGIKSQTELVQGGLRSIKESVENNKSLSSLVEQIQLQTGHVSLSQLLNHLRSLAIASDALKESEKVLRAWAQTGLKAGESRFSLGSQLEEIQSMLPHALHPVFPSLLESLGLPPSPIHPHAQGVACQPFLIESFLGDTSDPEFAQEVLFEWIWQEKRAWRKIWGPKEKESLRTRLMKMESQLDNAILAPIFHSVMSKTFLFEPSSSISTAPGSLLSLDRSLSSVKPLQRPNRSHYVLASSFKRAPRTDDESDQDQLTKKNIFSTLPPATSVSLSELQKTLYSPSLGLSDSISSLDRSPYPKLAINQSRHGNSFAPANSFLTGVTTQNMPRHHRSASSPVYIQSQAQEMRYTSISDGHLPSPKLAHWRTRSSSFGRSVEDVSMSQGSLPILEEQSEDMSTHIDLEEFLVSTFSPPCQQSQSVDGHLGHSSSFRIGGRAVRDMLDNEGTDTFSPKKSELNRDALRLNITLPRATASGDSLHLSRFDTDLAGHNFLGDKPVKEEGSLQNLKHPKLQSLTQLSKPPKLEEETSDNSPSKGVSLTPSSLPSDKTMSVPDQPAPPPQKKRFSFFQRRRPAINPPVAVVEPESKSIPIQVSQHNTNSKPGEDVSSVAHSSQSVTDPMSCLRSGSFYNSNSHMGEGLNTVSGLTYSVLEETGEIPRPDSPSSPSDESLLTRVWSHTGHRRLTVINPDVASDSNRSSLSIAPADILDEDSAKVDPVQNNDIDKEISGPEDEEEEEKDLDAIARVGSPVVEIRSSDAYPSILSREEDFPSLSIFSISPRESSNGYREMFRPREAEPIITSILNPPMVSPPVRALSMVNKAMFAEQVVPDRSGPLPSTNHTTHDFSSSALTLRGVFDSLPSGVVHSSGFVLEILMNYIDAERGRAMADPRMKGWGDEERGKVGWFLSELEESLVVTNPHLIPTFNRVRILTDCPPQRNYQPRPRNSRSGRASFVSHPAIPSTPRFPSFSASESSTAVTSESSPPLLKTNFQSSRQDINPTAQFRKKLRAHDGEETDTHLDAYAGYKDLTPPAVNGNDTVESRKSRRDRMLFPVALRNETAGQSRNGINFSYTDISINVAKTTG